jgi:hypothetical protein
LSFVARGPRAVASKRTTVYGTLLAATGGVVALGLAFAFVFGERVPDHVTAARGQPITGTSMVPAGEAPAENPEDVEADGAAPSGATTRVPSSTAPSAVPGLAVPGTSASGAE